MRTSGGNTIDKTHGKREHVKSEKTKRPVWQASEKGGDVGSEWIIYKADERFCTLS